MKILLVHNHYLHRGGEDQVFAAEADALRAHGHEIRLYVKDNSRIASMRKLALARSTIWSRQVFAEVTELLEEFAPDLVHCHNTFPLVSPAVYSAARRLSIPVVQTLHNFRLLCLNGLFLRNGTTCEDCLGRPVAWPGVVHACYRHSRQASAVVAAMLSSHRLRGTWRSDVNTYIAVSEFARAKFVAGGLPADRIVVKPNFLPEDPGAGAHDGGFALYVGRLSPEKGIGSLVGLWTRLAPSIPLHVIGTGPLDTLAADGPANIEWRGWLSRDQVLAAMKAATFLVFPTECYEGSPIVVLEAMATGLPIVASHRGSLPEILRDGTSAVLVPPGNPEHWDRALRWALAEPKALAEIGRRARWEFECKYTVATGYRQLYQIYQDTIEQARSLPPHVGLR